MEYKDLEQVENSINEFNRYHEMTIPLCAAENVLSEFCKLPLEGDFQERYIMGNFDTHNFNDNFIGSEYLLPFYSLVQRECNLLFDADFSDARTLSGMNCLTTLLMALTDFRDKLLILSPDHGGHMSVPPICERLGLNVFYAAYNIQENELDYGKVNEMVKREKIKFILLAPSDIIRAPALEKLELDNTILLYDASQTFGLIAGKQLPNPLNTCRRIIMFGGTHKTLPGPTCGLIMTKDPELYHMWEHRVNPTFMRNSQMHQVVSLLFCLLEMRFYGTAYSSAIVDLSNRLAKELSDFSFNVIRADNDGYSYTHQVFIECPIEMRDRIFRNGIIHRVTLNDKSKAIFNNSGIRLGTQEIARYGWGAPEIKKITTILDQLRSTNPDRKFILQIKESLPPKVVHYTFPQKTIDRFKNLILHQN